MNAGTGTVIHFCMDREQDIPFVYEDGVLKPQSAVDLPEGARGIAHLRPSESADQFWQGGSVDRLAAEQRVKPLRSARDLRGDWPPGESIDDFLGSLREGRN